MLRQFRINSPKSTCNTKFLAIYYEYVVQIRNTLREHMITTRFIDEVLPKLFIMAKIIQVSGAEAARQLGLTTEVPAKPVFLRRDNLERLKWEI